MNGRGGTVRLGSGRDASAGAAGLAGAAMAAAVALGLGAASGCTKGIAFPVTEDIPGTNVDGDPLLNMAGEVLPVAPLGPFGLAFDLEAELEAHDAGPAQEIFLEEMNVTVTDGLGDQDDDLAWLSSIRVTVESTMAGTALPPREIASRNDFPEGFATLPLNVDPDVDLLPYVEEGIGIVTAADGVIPPDDVQVGGDVTVVIRALAL